MSKSLSPYRAFTVAQIKSRASIPNQADMIEFASTVECYDITSMKIRNALGAGINAIGGLSVSGNVNQWSGFGPFERSYSNAGTLSAALNNQVNTPHAAGEFAGYNHNAPTPGLDHIWYSSWVLSGGAVTFDAYVNLGEVKYPSPAVALVLTIWDGGTLVGTGFKPLSECGATNSFVTCDVGSITSQKTFTCKVFLGDSLTEFQQNGSNAYCIVPNTTSVSKTVQIITASQFIVDAGGFTVYSAGVNYNTGQIAFSNAVASYNIAHVDVIARISRYDGVDFQDIVMYSDSYTANSNLFPTTYPAQFAKVPIPASGYTCQLLFQESQ